MAEQTTSKRIRTVVNYAALNSLDISDDDDFSGFSSPPPIGQKSLNKKANEKSKLQKKKKSAASCNIDSCSTDTAVSSAEPDSDAANTSISGDESDGSHYLNSSSSKQNSCSTGRKPRARPSLQDKLFQRDLKAAISLSKQSAELVIAASDNSNKENEGDHPTNGSRPSSSPPRVTRITVPVEVHSREKIKHPCARQPVIHKTFTFPHTSKLLDQQSKTPDANNESNVDDKNEITVESDINSDQEKPGTPIGNTEGKSTKINLNKRKARFIESDEDDFNSSNGKLKCLSKVKCMETGKEDVSKCIALSDKLDDPDVIQKEKSSATTVEKNTETTLQRKEVEVKESLPVTEEEMETLAAGRGKRTRKAISFADSSSDSENEWAEEDELDQDHLSDSISEGSDFEPSPKKKKDSKNNKKTTKTLVNTRKTSCQTRGSSSGNKKTDETPTARSIPTRPMRSTSDKQSSSLQTTNCALPEPSNTNTIKSTNSRTATMCSSPSTKSSNNGPANENTTLNTNNNSVNSNNVVDKTCNNSLIKTSPAVSRSSPSSGGLTRGAFKSPFISPSTAVSGTRVVTKTSPAHGSLRLGLSRKANFKSLHPNATVN